MKKWIGEKGNQQTTRRGGIKEQKRGIVRKKIPLACGIRLYRADCTDVNFLLGIFLKVFPRINGTR